VIYISNEDISRVEYLLSQSARGNHILFSAEEISRVFKKKSPEDYIPDESYYQVEHHIEKLVTLPSLVQKKAYLEKLEIEVVDKIILTYFNLIDQTLFHDKNTRH